MRTIADEPPQRHWGKEERQLLAGPAGFTRVMGGPGTGKTTLLATVAAQRLRNGAEPAQVLVLTHSRRSADMVRTLIAHDLAGDKSTNNPAHGITHTMREPMVRTIHSYAFAVLRLHAMRQGLPAPRLLSSPEQDVVVRELLAGDIDSGASYWPERLRPALGVPGFAEELRDLLMRAAERGLNPSALQEMGRRHQRIEWVAAGQFWQQYEEVTSLQGASGGTLGTPSSPAFDAAELVSAAIHAFADDPQLLGQERNQVRHLLVDDAQHLDPLQYQLLRQVGSGAADFIVTGDPHQSVFSFRGADPSLLTESDPNERNTLTLTRNWRMSSAVATSVARLGQKFPNPIKPMLQPDDTDGGTVRVQHSASVAAEANWVANQLRRAHLVDGIPWPEMSVLTRSPGRNFPVLQRALRAAGVPIASIVDEVPLAQQSAVRPLLLALEVSADSEKLDVDTAETLLSSSLGGADPLALRRIRRGLRRLELAGGGQRSSDELLLEALNNNDVLIGLADSEIAPIRRLTRILHSTRELIRHKAGIEEVLWGLWSASGLAERWSQLSQRGGSLGTQADHDLDSVVALFHAAGNYATRLPEASVTGFVRYLAAQHIVGDSIAPTALRGDGVSLLTTHSAVGREWTVVAVVGAQEGSWPDIRLRGTLLGVERLTDLLTGIDVASTSLIAPILAEERRLFYVAASRARKILLVSAVAGEDEQPSRFLADLGDDNVNPATDKEKSTKSSDQRSLILADLVGELRRVVCDSDADIDRRRLAGQQLARLARAGVPGAHPHSWYGIAEESTVQPLYASGDTIKISPSTVDILAKCPLRWLLERHGGSDPAQLAAVTGTLVHELAQAAASGLDDEQLRKALDEAWAKVDAGAPWFSRRERRRVEHMLNNFLAWLENSRSELTELGLEHDIEVELPPGEHGLRVRLRGRVDRVEKDGSGRPVVIDIKTSKSPVSENDAENHPQLAAYQLAILLGGFSNNAEPGGARLVYVAKSNLKTGCSERKQSALNTEAAQKWLTLVHNVATSATGPRYIAMENPDCDRCPARTSCPLRPEGRQVTDA